jgi:hypothetical protein
VGEAVSEEVFCEIDGAPPPGLRPLIRLQRMYNF